MSEDRSKERFIQTFDQIEIMPTEKQLRDEYAKNLHAMQNKNLSDKQFLKFSDENIEIQRQLNKLRNNQN